MDFEDLLQQFKDSFEDWRALAVLDDKALRRYVMCWTPAMVSQRRSYPLGDSLSDLWDCVDVNLSALGDLTGDGQADVLSRFRQVQGMQLVYPDGTVAYAVRKLLTSKVKDNKGV